MKWKPEEEKLTDFVFRFSQLAHELSYTDDQQISHFILCIPRGLYLYLEGAKTIPDAVENCRKGIALGGLDTFNFASEMVDNRKPVVPFMAVKEHRKQMNTEDTIKIVKESIQDSIYENNKTMMRLLDKIGDRLANVVEDFQKKQSSRNSRNRHRDRGIEITQEIVTGIEVEIEEDQTQGRIETTNKDQVQVKDICDYCNRTGHSTHECFKLENYLKKQGKRIVLHDNDDLQDIAQAVQDLNTKINSMKQKSSTNN